MHDQPGGPRPVFVDGTGRRRRLTVIAGAAMGVGLLTSLVLILAGLFLDTSVSVPGWSDDRAPIGTGVGGQDDLGGRSPAAPEPAPATSTTAPRPRATSTPATAATSAVPAPRPTPSDRPGRGNGPQSSGKPSKSPGKPG